MGRATSPLHDLETIAALSDDAIVGLPAVAI
jgi:hypothetical protein